MVITREYLVSLSSYELERLLESVNEDIADQILMLLSGLYTEESIDIPDD